MRILFGVGRGRCVADTGIDETPSAAYNRVDPAGRLSTRIRFGGKEQTAHASVDLTSGSLESP